MGHIQFFLKKPIFTFVVIFILMWLGVSSFLKLNVETLPEVKTPVIYAAIPLPGGAPEEVESLITNPIEEKLSELDDVQRIMSSSWQNVSLVVVYFKDSVNPEVKFKEFREKIAAVRPTLPAEAMEPIIEEINFENLPMMFVGFPGRGKSQYELSLYATKIKKEIEALPGIKRVAMLGATDKRVEVNLDPFALKTYGSGPLKLLAENIGRINTNMPGGNIFLFGKEYAVRTIGKFNGIDDLRNLVVAATGTVPVHLSDIATVEETYPDPATIVHVDGERGISLGIMKKNGYGTLDVAARVKKTLAKYKGQVVMADSSEFIKHQMGDLKTHALWGCCLVMLILFLTLGFRTAAIVTLALPMSFLMTFTAMRMYGMTINMVTLFSLLLALGMMVDNSIVVCENIFRHRSLGKHPYEASLAGASEVGWPIFSSTAAIIAAFLPMAVFLTGPIGEFTRPISIVVSFALVSSLIVANFFNPLFCQTFIRDVVNEGEDSGGKFITRARRAYGRIIGWCLDHGSIVMSSALVLLVVCVMLVVLKIIGLQLFPQLDTAKFYIDMKMPAGSTTEDTTAAVARMEDVFGKSKYVKNYIANIGSSGTRIEIDDHIYFGSNIARFIVDLKPRSEIDRSHKQVVQDFRGKFSGMFDDGTRIHFIEKVLGPPVGSPIEILATGKDFDRLEKMTVAIRELLSRERGVIDLKDNMPGKVPQIVLRANHETLGRAGLTTREMGGFIFLTLTGYKIGDIMLGDERKDIFLKINQGEGGPMAMQSATFTLPNGQEVPVSDLLSYEFTEGLSAVEHENGKRTVTIGANVVKGIEAKRVIDKLKVTLNKRRAELIKEDPGMAQIKVTFGGEDMLIDAAAHDLTTALIVSLVLIYLILLVEFRSTTQPLIILVCVPYALVGVIVGLLIMGYSFSVLAGIGLLCLIGIVVNNGIIYIDFANLLQERGMPRRDACIEACKTRLRPIVLTKLTVILGIMPLAMASASKTQFWKPLCWAIIWGLVIATTLTLIIIPVAYYITEGWRKKYYKKHIR